LDNLKGRDHLDIDWRLKWHLKKQDMRMWTVFNRLRIENSGGLL